MGRTLVILVTMTVAVIVAAALLFSGCQSAPEQRDEPGPVEVQEEDEMERTELPEGFDVQGHRGARGLSPESTLPSFEVALDLLVDTLEVDLHLSRDDELIIWHDPFVEARKCRVNEDAGELSDSDQALKVRNLTADELSRFVCDRNPDAERFPDQRAASTPLAGDNFSIITLAQLFDFVEAYAASEEKTEAQRQNARTVHFNIETKRVVESPEFIDDGFDGENPSTFEQRLVELIEARGLEQRTNLQSFDHRSLWAAKSIAPWLELAVLDREVPVSFDEYVAREAAIWSPRARLVTSENLQAAQAAGLKVIPWTVNDTDEMERLIRLGVDGLITDRPDRLVSFRRETPEQSP